MENKNNRRLKLSLMAGVFIATFVIILVGGIVTAVQSDKGAHKSIDKKNADKVIAGIKPVDVYLNFEKQGFTTKKDITATSALFRSTSTDNGIDYEVLTYCAKGVDDVTSISLTATRTSPQDNTVDDMKAFLKYGCSIPYDGADVQKALSFIEGNYFVNKASINISGVKFTIFTPTEFSRIVEIEKE